MRSELVQVGRPALARLLVGGLAVVLTLWIGSSVLVFFAQRSLIYQPDTRHPGPVSAWITHGRDVTLHPADGLKLTAWVAEPTGPDAGAGRCVLYAPGNGGARSGRARVAESIAARGYTVLLLEYRGFGGNPGSPSEDGLTLDALAAAGWLAANGCPGDRTVYVGESLGTGILTRLATTDPPAGIVLRSPFPSLTEVAQRQFPLVPVGVLLVDRFDTISRLPAITAPISVLAGTGDTLVPPEQSAAVAAAVRNLFVHEVVVNATHNDPVWFGPEFVDQVDALGRATIPG